MKTVLIVYHSQSGSCARLAQAALAGANEEGTVAVRLLRACDTATRDLAACDALLMVAAENSGSLAGDSKALLDRVFYPAIARELVRPYALLVSAGNDGRGAVAQAQRILKGIPLVPATEPVICRGEVDERHLERATELGQALAAGIALGIF